MAKHLTIECPLDVAYEQLYMQARGVAAAYLEHANWVIKNTTDKKLYTHLLISVRIKTPGCWVATWVKKVDIHDSEQSKAVARKLRRDAPTKPGRSATLELPKGRGTSYPASTFTSLPLEVRGIAIHYERLLSGLRKAANENRLAKRAATLAQNRSLRTASECAAALEATRVFYAFPPGTHDQTESGK
jgi:hypothetical protein